MAKRITKAQWRRKKRMKKLLIISISIVALIIVVFQVLPESNKLSSILDYFTSNNIGKDNITQTLADGRAIKVDYLTPNPYSRPQKKLRRINGVVVHYTANPGAEAENNRSYFEGLAQTHITYASSHYIVGLQGEIIQCVPLTEIAYASNDRNDDTVSIECCHPDKTGKFNKKTYQSLVSLVAALCTEFDIDEKDIIRHYDVTGKLCPLYYVKHEDEWEQFKDDVMKEVSDRKTNTK